MTDIVSCAECSTPILRPSHAKQKFCGLSCSNASKNRNALANRVKAYEANPRLCLHCTKPITYQQTKEALNPKFCSSSCSAKTNNHLHPKRHKKHGARVVMKAKDWHENRFLTHTLPRIELGLVSKRKTLKQALYRLRGRKCECCGITEWQGESTPIELDHIDGNAGNNLPDNLRLLCPNCHAQTPTHKGKNKGSGRRSRGLRPE